jgi:hypothetical protein
MAEFKAAPAAERQPYTYFSWPATMESDAIPWEASRALLDWLKFRTIGGRRQPPLTHQAVWFWWLTQAVPDAPIEERDILSFFYTLVDMSDTDAARKAEARAHLQWWAVVFQVWSCDDAEKEYRAAITAGTIPKHKFSIRGNPMLANAKGLWNPDEIEWILRRITNQLEREMKEKQ